MTKMEQGYAVNVSSRTLAIATASAVTLIEHGIVKCAEHLFKIDIYDWVSLIFLGVSFFPIQWAINKWRFSQWWAQNISLRKKKMIRLLQEKLFPLNVEEEMANPVVTFPGRARTLEVYRKDVADNIQNSTKIYILAVTGYSFFYDQREIFMSECLSRYALNDENKDIRFKFLDPRSKIWHDRVYWYLNKLKTFGVPPGLNPPESVEEYELRCRNIEEKLSKAWPYSISFYENEPFYRIFIFDDCLFISLYGKYDLRGTHTFTTEEGHLTPVIRIRKNELNPLYYVFYNIFAAV